MPQRQQKLGRSLALHFRREFSYQLGGGPHGPWLERSVFLSFGPQPGVYGVPECVGEDIEAEDEEQEGAAGED
jgi:hypothetical protein